jgi:hypothetical protein
MRLTISVVLGVMLADVSLPPGHRYWVIGAEVMAFRRMRRPNRYFAAWPTDPFAPSSPPA